MGLLQLSLEKVPTQPRGAILARSKLCILFLGWFPSVPFFLGLISHAGEKEKKERERERDSATEDKGAVGLIGRMDSDPSGSPNRS